MSGLPYLIDLVHWTPIVTSCGGDHVRLVRRYKCTHCHAVFVAPEFHGCSDLGPLASGLYTPEDSGGDE